MKTNKDKGVKMKKWTTEEVLEIIGGLEKAVYGSTLEGMAEYERKNARNNYRKLLADCFNYHWEWYEVDQGKWVPNKPNTPLLEVSK